MTVATAASVSFETPADYKDEIRARAHRVRWLTIPARRYLAIDGTDAPGSPGFRDAIRALYPTAYTLHFLLKRRGVEAPVGALQGLYWLGEQQTTPDLEFRGPPEGRGGWRWRLLLAVPDAAAAQDVYDVIVDLRAKKSLPRIDELRVLPWDEGPAAQIMHVGTYSDEPRTIAHLQRAIADAGLRLRGVHHEIYVSDPQRARPEGLKTVLRQDVTV